MTPPPRPPRSDHFGVIAAVLGGLIVALAAVLVIVLVSRGGDDTSTTGAAGSTTSAPPGTSTTAAATTTAAPTTTGATTTTAAPTTTSATTTTVPPFDGTLDDKSAPPQGTPAGRLDDIRAADHPGFARIVFDFPAGGIPGYFISYANPTTLVANFFPLSWTTPYDPDIFDAGGNRAIGEGSIVRVHDGGMGAGSGEWAFEIVVTSQKPFRVGTLDGPPRIYIDIAD